MTPLCHPQVLYPHFPIRDSPDPPLDRTMTPCYCASLLHHPPVGAFHSVTLFLPLPRRSSAFYFLVFPPFPKPAPHPHSFRGINSPWPLLLLSTLEWAPNPYLTSSYKDKVISKMAAVLPASGAHHCCPSLLQHTLSSHQPPYKPFLSSVCPFLPHPQPVPIP